ncbi:hypothetical protein SNE40_007370 [Patella caerulea]|uniref:N-acetylgalactosaminide beta-1,3-galactosyltransferase n=1 Tax=Patella caerulea TaxID=87958 RepID=A0AAN8K4G6_PATCE
MIDDTVSKKLMKKIRILCWVTTVPGTLESKARAVNNTWAKRCDKTLFVIADDPSLPENTQEDILRVKVPNGRNHLTAKTVQTLKYIHNHYLTQYDWFLKADDDTYIVMENLKFLLSHYNHRKPIYLGHLFKKYSKYGYMSGGAGYVLSRKALRMLVKKGYRIPGKCREDGGDEDVALAHCLQSVNVHVHSTIDKFGRESFLPFSGFAHVYGPMPPGLEEWDRNVPKIGSECCSQLLISFHYVKPDFMLMLEHLLYRTSVYGRKISEEGVKNLFNIGPVKPLTYSPKR